MTELVAYIAAERTSAAIAIAGRIEKCLKLLSKHPHLGRVPNDEHLVGMGYRLLVAENYLIFYTLEQETILVHRILHGARDYLRLL